MGPEDFETFETFETFDAIRIAYRDVGNGPVAFMHHGFASDSRTNWIRPGVARAVVDSGRRVVLIDARGHGNSDKPHDPAAYVHGAMVRDVQHLLGLLEIDEVDMIGYSMGSLVSIKLALVEPRVRSLVLGGVGTRQSSVFDPRQASRIADALEASDKTTIGDRTALAFRSFADATGADRLALAAVQRSRTAPPPEGSLASIEVPTLVINGREDTLVGRIESVAEAIPGARLVVVPGDHLSAVVKPEFKSAIVEFLASR